MRSLISTLAPDVGAGIGSRTDTQIQVRTIEDSAALNHMEQEWNAARSIHIGQPVLSWEG
jgi:hypothetical protein